MARRLGRARQSGEDYGALPGGSGNVGILNGRKAGIANNTATAIITVTVPNGMHNASLRVKLMGHLGAGTDASETTRVAEGSVAIARTTGAATVAVASTLESAAIATVAGGGTLTLAYAVSAISGAVGVTQTFTITVTLVVTGTITDHVAMFSAELMNSASGGVTIAAA